MTDTTVKKVSAAYSPTGDMGQKYLASGKRVSIRLWEAEPAEDTKAPSVRDCETVGYVITGRAELQLEGQTVMLEAGDSCWCRRAEHSYAILEPFTAIEATGAPSAGSWPRRAEQGLKAAEVKGEQVVSTQPLAFGTGGV